MPTTTRLPAILAEGRALLALAWPMVIAQLAKIGTGVVDTIMAGHYSATDLAAIAIGYNIWLPLYLLILGVILGSTYMIAQHVGAGRIQRVRDSLPQALWLALALGLVISPLCYFAEPLLQLLDLAGETQDRSLGYLQAVAFGMTGAALFEALRCHSQGIGILRPFAVASVLGFLANIPLNYALMYGSWGFPEMGARGCGWATAISMWLSPALIGFYMLRAEQLKPYLPELRLVAPQLAAIAAIVRVGLPLGLTFFVEVAFFSVIAMFIATMGDTAIASHQIAFNVWDVVYMPLIACGSAMATRVGQAIGAGNRSAMRLSIGCGISMTVMVGLLGMVALLAAPGLIARAYTNDLEITAMAVLLIRLAALFIAIDSAQVATTFCLRAFKDTDYPFLAMCIAYWLITLPLGYWLGIVSADNPLDGTVAFWQSMIAGITVASLLVFGRLYWRLRRPLSVAD
ncbi:MAG: MATE family efflux transporter [Halieaceae bacterium]|nr:MATE family efflux transporter [Halieaceae bacterium]